MNPRKSVKIRLMASFMVVSVFLVLSTLLEFYTLFFFRHTLEEITAERLPPLILAQKLATQSERIVATAPSLIASVDENERNMISDKISSEIEALSRLIGELGHFSISVGMVKELESDFKSFIAYIRQIDQAVSRKLVLTAEEQNRYNQILKTYKESENIINPAISLFRAPVDEWVESHSSGVGERIDSSDIFNKAGSGSSYDTQIPSSGVIPQMVDQLLPLVDIRIKVSSLTNMLLSVATEQDADKLDLIGLKCRSYIADIREQSEHLVPELARAHTELIRKFKGYSDAPDSLLEMRREILGTILEAGRLSQESRTLSVKINTAVQKLIADTRSDVQTSTQRAERAQAIISVILIVVTAVSLLFSTAMGWIYVGRRVIRPIEALASAARDIEQGDLDRQVAVDGDDEIGNLARAFNSMVIKRKEAEISLRKAHNELEQRVQERTSELSIRNGQLNQEIMERIASEEKRRELEEKLRQSHKLEAVGRLSGGIAHEFNNLLAIILGNAEMLMDDLTVSSPDSPVQDSYGASSSPLKSDLNPSIHFVKEMIAASLRGKEIVAQLLSFSRPGELNHKILDICSTAHRAVEFMRISIPSTIEFKVDIPSEKWLVQGNETQINQIMINLANNAAYAMEESGGVLDIALDKVIFDQPEHCFNATLPSGAYISLKMQDSGRGMQPEELDRVFDPFYTTKSVGEGSGMGLTVAHGIMKGHGGGIRIRSYPGQGTVVECYFPAVKTVEDQTGDGAVNRNKPLLSQGNEHILYVDDEPMVVKMGQVRLERMGFRVTTSTDPLEALEIFRSNPEQFDLVITDLTMPGISGSRLVAMLKEITPSVKIIICSGYNESLAPGISKEMGADAFLMKPNTMSELSAAVRSVLDG